MMTVTIIDAVSSAKKESDVRPRLPNDVRREPERKNAISAVRIAMPAAAMPMQYRTKVAFSAVVRAFRPFWMSSGKSRSVRLMCRPPASSCWFRCFSMLK